MSFDLGCHYRSLGLAPEAVLRDRVGHLSQHGHAAVAELLAGVLARSEAPSHCRVRARPDDPAADTRVSSRGVGRVRRDT